MKIQEQYWIPLILMTFLYRCKTVLQIKLHGRPFGIPHKEATSHDRHHITQRDRQRQIQKLSPKPAPSVSLVNGEASDLD
ncbi:hypothetical protein BA900_06395 [Spiribacter roseus]|nr:hypothetical protein BA900_06395 [Spiribacter roseus]